MEAAKRKRLEAKGWRIGDAQAFLGLTDAEAVLVDVKARLAKAFSERRSGSAITQTEAARRLGSSKERVAKIEAGDPSVSLDLLVRDLLALGATLEDLAGVLASPQVAPGRRRRGTSRAA